jgi:hypothetical protein
MKVKEFLVQKNAIVEKVTGKILIPEDQIENVPFKKLNLCDTEGVDGELSIQLNAQICPYCEAYRETFPSYGTVNRLNCEPCIMNKKGNKCIGSEETKNTSTWEDCTDLWDELATEEDMIALMELVEKYNKENIN